MASLEEQPLEQASSPGTEPLEPRSKAISVAMQPDALTMDNQNYALISFVSPNGTYQQADQMLLKIRGVFATADQARERAKMLSELDGTFDLFIVDMYKWIPFPPKVNLKREGDDRITDILNNFFERDEQSKADLESRLESVRKEGKGALLEDEQ